MDNSMSPLITAEESKGIIHEAGVVIVDARGGADAKARYLNGHMQGAIMLSLENDLSNIGPDAARGGRHPLPAPSAFGALLGRVGVTPSSHILVYDDKSGANAAARFWWMMKALGHAKIQVIDGGFAAIQRAGLPISKLSERPAQSSAAYPVAGWQLPTASIEDVDRARSDQATVIIDVREAYRYKGESEPIDHVAGHIPGAINIPYVNNLDGDGTFHSAEKLREGFRAILGDAEKQNIVVHCGSGVTACHTLLAMNLAGLPMGRLYVGSWSEWSRNQKPIATGDTP